MEISLEKIFVMIYSFPIFLLPEFVLHSDCNTCWVIASTIVEKKLFVKNKCNNKKWKEKRITQDF